MGSGDFRFIYNDLFSKDPTITNRFNNYKLPFGYSDTSKSLDDILGKQTGILTRNAANTVQRGQRDTASRLASQGITGGSVFNNQINKTTDATNQSFADALEQLGLGRIAQDVGLMNQENANQFNITGAASGIDRGNANAWMQRAGLLSSIMGNQTQAEQFEANQPTWLDDLFAGLGQIGQIAAIPTGFGAFGPTGNILSSLFKSNSGAGPSGY